jgi:alkylhydroperoxidase family enzyme
MSDVHMVDSTWGLGARFSAHPALFQKLRDYAARVWAEGADPVVLEICRVRIAQLLSCESELHLRYQPAIDAGLTEEKFLAVSQYSSSPLFNDHERACLELAELFIMDAHAISDEDFAKALAGCSPREMMTIMTAIALFESLDRIRLAMGLGSPSQARLVVPSPQLDQGTIY